MKKKYILLIAKTCHFQFLSCLVFSCPVYHQLEEQMNSNFLKLINIYFRRENRGNHDQYRKRGLKIAIAIIASNFSKELLIV